MSINDNRVFAPSNTGTKAHAFLGSRGAKPGNLRAACRVTIQRSATGTTFISLDRARKFYTVCDNCVKLYQAAEDRADNSMRPATEADDLGYVAPVDERTETPQPAAEVTPAQLTALRVIADNPGKVIAMVRGNREFLTINGNVENKLSALGMIRARHAGTTVTNGKTHELKVWELTESGSDALSTEAAPQPAAEQPQPVLTVGGLTFYAKQTEATPIAAPLVDLSTEDGTVKLANGDELTRRGHWADVWLADGRTYSVSMKVHRKGAEGPSTILVDHVIYWAERDGRSTGPIQIACVDDKPRSVGGRIWRLLLAANIA